ncbi:hypothetical protein ABK040_001136 [Willaertia magna]
MFQPSGIGGLRKRTVITDEISSTSTFQEKRINNFVRRIKNFDLYTKTESVAVQKTTLGGVISTVTIIIIIFLVLSAFIRYITVQRRDTLSVDTQVEDRVVIFFNITFPDVKCYDLHVDSVDASGDATIDVLHNIHKSPVDEKNRLVHLDYKHKTKLGTQMPQLKYDPRNDPHSPLYCGSCYDFKDQYCCNSCHDVLEIYKRKGKEPPRKEDIEQCLNDVARDYPGCNMYGTLEVQKVNGNFHFAPGRSFSQERDTYVHHIHEFNPILVGRFNSTHIVHALSFGLRIPPVTYPLDDTIGVIPKIEENDLSPPKTALFKYFIKVVPTTYKPYSIFSRNVYTYQFSYTKHVMPFDISKTVMLPGVFFVFNFEPIRITYTEYTIPFTHFIVELMAVCAGIFVVSSYVDALLELTVKKFSKKQQ